MSLLSLFEVALVEVFLELVVVFDTVIIVPIGLVLHYDTSSMSVSSGTTSPHLLLPSF